MALRISIITKLVANIKNIDIPRKEPKLSRTALVFQAPKSSPFIQQFSRSNIWKIEKMETKPRDIVNGQKLQGFTNKYVSITGFVTEIGANGMSFNLRAADNEIVKISLKRPLDKPLEGYVEVHGTSTGKGVMADEFIIFNNETFDAKAHNRLCELLYSINNLWNTS